MPAVSATAPGKIILLGEHAVVYDRPAIAIPFNGAHAKVIVFATPLAPTSQVRIEAQAIELDQTLDQLEADHPIAIAVHGVMSALGIHWLPACHIRITSTIPMAAGMGSSAAISIALSRAVSTFLGHPLADDVINDIAYQVETRLHGTPSGVDNTVICYGRPVYFVRKHRIEFLKVNQQFDLLVADCGISAATGPMVSGVKQRHEEHPEQYEQYFNQITELVNEARLQLESGSTAKIGRLLTANHRLLQNLGVSTAELDRLVDAALNAGAFGAKLTGGGGGGNMIALVDEAHVAPVTTALLANGAHKTWLATVPRHEESAS